MKEKATTSNFGLGIRFVSTQSRPEKKNAIFTFPQFVRNLDIRF